MESWTRVELDDDDTLFVAQEDVKDYFYRLGISKELGEYFALPKVNMGKLKAAMGSAWTSALEAMTGGGTVDLFPYFSVLPMGFSWAFHLAQEAHRFVAQRCIPSVRLLEDKHVAPPMRGGHRRFSFMRIMRTIWAQTWSEWKVNESFSQKALMMRGWTRTRLWNRPPWLKAWVFV